MTDFRGVDIKNSTLEFPEDNLCVAKNCQATALGQIHIPFCDYHARKAYARVSAYYGARIVARSVLEGRQRGPTKATLRKGFVYIIRFGTRVKIGYTTDPARRMSDLPHDEILLTIPGTVVMEADLHAKFQHLRITGEWFEAAPEILDFASALKSAAA